MSLEEGYNQIYTGKGRAKLLRLVGQTLQAAGKGLKTFIVQFMKNSPC